MAIKNKIIAGGLYCTLICQSFAGDWTFKPAIKSSETYSNNVELTQTNKTGSFVNQTGLDLSTTFDSRLFQFSLNADSTYASYSHDHSIDDSYRTLLSNAKLSLWTNGPAITFQSSINNVSRNGANNSLADIVSGDTVEARNVQTGLEYNVKNRDFTLQSSINYFTYTASDNIGKRKGYNAVFKTESKQSTNAFLWQINSNYTDQSNDNFDGQMYQIEAIIGSTTPYNIRPFIRYYDEDSTGNFSNTRITSGRSIGPGIRWNVSSHLYVDLSYNFPSDKSKTDNYIASAINWQPSSRTSLEASFSQRFFGDSYGLKFSHKLRRLTNSINYNETIEAFDRNSYQQVSLGNYWCPINEGTTLIATDCFVQNNQAIDPAAYQLVTLYDQQLIEGNEFSLNKRLTWQSTLALARTTFSMNINQLKRESLTTGRIEKTRSANVTMSRKTSRKSQLTLGFNFNHREFDSTGIQGAGQNDYYRTFSTSYNRQLARLLSIDFSINYLNRNSTVFSRTYKETRAIIAVKKDF